MRKTIAGSQEWDLGSSEVLRQKGGGIQYEIIGDQKKEWFGSSLNDISELFK